MSLIPHFLSYSDWFLTIKKTQERAPNCSLEKNSGGGKTASAK